MVRLVILLVLLASKPAAAETLSHVHVRGAGEPGRYIVTYTLPSAGVARLDLVDMTTHAPECPSVRYEFEAAHGAARTDDAGHRTLISLTPESNNPITVRYSVWTEDPGGLSLGTDVACDLIIEREGQVFLDGKALFAAPRPVDASGAPFRFGPTVLDLSPAPFAPLAASLEADGGDGMFRVDHFDALRFALFFAGQAAPSQAGVSIAALGPGRLPADLAIQDARHAMLEFEALFGAAAPGSYLIVLIDTPSGAPGDLIATARTGGHIMVTGARAGRLISRIINIHELAHQWDLSRFRVMDAAQDLTWMREGLAEYLSFRALTASGAISARETVGRANIALYNIAHKRVPGSLPYDRGFLVWLSLDHASGDTAHLGAMLQALIEPSPAALTEAELWRTAHALGLRESPAGPFEAARDLPCTLIVEEREHHLTAGFWPLYDTGYEHRSKDHDFAPIVAPDGPAAAVGLRETDRVSELVSGAYGEILRDVTLRLEDDRMLTYRPHGPRSPVSFMQYVAPDNPDLAGARAERIAECRP